MVRDMKAVPSLSADKRIEVRDAIDASFTAAFRVAMFGAAALAVAAAIVGSDRLNDRSPEG